MCLRRYVVIQHTGRKLVQFSKVKQLLLSHCLPEYRQRYCDRNGTTIPQPSPWNHTRFLSHKNRSFFQIYIRRSNADFNTQFSPFVIKVGKTVFNHDSNNIIRSIVVEDRVDMASFCSIMFDASIDQGRLLRRLRSAGCKIKDGRSLCFAGEIISIDHSFQ